MSGQTCMKVVLVLFNIIFVLLGIVSLILGIILKVDVDLVYQFLSRVGVNQTWEDVLSKVSDDTIKNLLGGPVASSVGVGLIIFGCVSLVLGLLGACGACKTSKCLLYIYIVLVTILTLAQVALVIAFYGFRSTFKNLLEPELDKSVKKYSAGSKNADTEFWDIIHTSFKCCGLKGPADFTAAPASCCQSPTSTTPCGATATNGCFSTFEELIESSKPMVLGITIGAIVIQIILLIFAGLLSRADKVDPED